AALVQNMRIDSVRGENVALQSLGENGPDFTLRTETGALSRSLKRQAAEIARSSRDADTLERTGVLIPVFVQSLERVQSAIRAGDAKGAKQAFVYLHSASELLQTALDRAADRATATGDEADRNAD